MVVRRRPLARRDVNHNAIVSALLVAGASVCDLAAVGGGVPDLLVGYRGVNRLLEIKRDQATAFGRGKFVNRAVRERQSQWAARWRGRPVVVVTTPEEALAAIGAIRPETASRDRPGSDNGGGREF